MSKSVQVGLEVALRVEGVQCILLQLGDHPHVSPSTLEGIIASALERGTAVAPRYQGRNGHPIAIPTRVARSILEAELPGGLADWFRADEWRRNFMDVDDQSVVMDIDTPGDLERAAESATQ